MENIFFLLLRERNDSRAAARLVFNKNGRHLLCMRVEMLLANNR